MEQQGAQLLAREWLVDPNWPQAGKGDLVFLLPDGSHLAVEVKAWCTSSCGGKTFRTRRTKHRSKVRQQAWQYGRAWHVRQRGAVQVYAATYTTEWGLRFVACLPAFH